MKDSLRPGITTSFSYLVPETKTVPHLYPEAPEFQTMPRVFATGFMVGLVEWTCMQAIREHLDWPAEQSVGTDVKLTHSAATPPGLTVSVRVELTQVDGRRLIFSVSARDDFDEIARGTHERYVIDSARFESGLARKRGV